MPIVLSRLKTNPVTGEDLDSHLQIPDNSSGTHHSYFNKKSYVYGASNNETRDRENSSVANPSKAPPGTETISNTEVRRGIHSYNVHDYTNGYTNDNASSIKLVDSGVSVTVYYNNTAETINAPSGAGTLWRVFNFTFSGGVQRVGTLSHQKTPTKVY